MVASPQVAGAVNTEESKESDRVRSHTAFPEGRTSATTWSHRSELGPTMPPSTSPSAVGRPTVACRFLYVGDQKLLAVAAIVWGELIVAAVLGGLAALLGGLIWEKCGAAVATLRKQVRDLVDPGLLPLVPSLDSDEPEPVEQKFGASPLDRRRRHVLADRPTGPAAVDFLP